MYPGKYAFERADEPCFIMASSGEVVTYGEYEERTNRLAHLLRDQGLQRMDHYSIFMENNARYLEMCGAGERAGLYYTAINSHLTAEELAYIVNNSESRVLITSRAMRDVALAVVPLCPNVERWLMVDAGPDDAPFEDYLSAVSGYPSTRLPDERNGAAMLYSSGTTGRPKGILRQLPDVAPDEALPLMQFLIGQWRYREGMTYLSPAPLYHSAPQGAVGLTIRSGGTAIIMERFDPEQYLQLVEQYGITHSQLVPTMFNRMLKLPEEVKSPLRPVVAGDRRPRRRAVPDPGQGADDRVVGPGDPRVLRGDRGHRLHAVRLRGVAGPQGHGRVGQARGAAHPRRRLPRGPQRHAGHDLVRGAGRADYWRDPEKTQEAATPDGKMHTTNDVGYVDDDGWLFLTDRKSFMIISGGVNIYPQETENLLVTHPKVADAAVFGVPNADLGEEVKAVVQPMPGVEPGPELEAELMAFCQQHLSRQKCPRSIDFEAELPRLPTGKLYKKTLRDRYWGDTQSRIVQ